MPIQPAESALDDRARIARVLATFFDHGTNGSAFAAASITVGRNVARRLRLRVALVQIEAVLLAELQLLEELLPLRRELLGAADHPRMCFASCVPPMYAPA